METHPCPVKVISDLVLATYCRPRRMILYYLNKQNNLILFKHTLIVVLSEVREREILYIPYMQNPKGNDINEVFYETETDSQS